MPQTICLVVFAKTPGFIYLCMVYICIPVMCIWLCDGTCMHESTWSYMWTAEVLSNILIALNISFWDLKLATLTKLAGQWVLRSVCLCAPSHTAITDPCCCVQLLGGHWDLNSGPHVYTINTLPWRSDPVLDALELCKGELEQCCLTLIIIRA